MTTTPLITNDATVLGLLAIILGAVFYTNQSNHPSWQKFYKFVPALLLCYFLPSLLNTFGVVDGHGSNLYYVASRFLLPACLVLLTISVDIPGIVKLGPKALILFLTGTLGIVIGGPIALLVVSAIFPDLLGVNAEGVWRGMTTIAGSWIGGGANQTAMKEVFELANYDVGGEIFSAMVTVDIFVGNLWLAVLLVLAGNAKRIDARTGADTSAINALRHKVEEFEKKHARMPMLPDIMIICAIGFGVTGFAHLVSDLVTPWMVEHFPEGKKLSFHSKFFWMIVTASVVGVSLSFTKLRKIETVGASKIASAFFIHINCNYWLTYGYYSHCRYTRILLGWFNLDDHPCNSDVVGSQTYQSAIVLHGRWQPGQCRWCRLRASCSLGVSSVFSTGRCFIGGSRLRHRYLCRLVLWHDFANRRNIIS